MFWSRILLVPLSFLAASVMSGNDGALDPEFRKVPFDEWFTRGGDAAIKWTVRVLRPRLSSHQRLLAQVEAIVDGREFAKRLEKGGDMLVFAEVDDAAGEAYQNHVSLDMQKMKETIRSSDVSCAMSFFVLPGDYRVRMALYNTATGEHSAREEKLHVAAMKADPLPDMWRDLPAVEFLDPAEPPDGWYLPSVSGRLNLPVTTTKAVRVEVLVNLTPSERLSGSSRVQNRNLGALLPALKAISQVDLGNGSMNLEMLDLSRQKVAFHQENVRGLDWPAMKDRLTDAHPGVIDVKSLENRRGNADFFVHEVGRIIDREAESVCALIVLSPPVEFETRQDVQPVERSSGCRVFYIRYRAPAFNRQLAFGPDAGMRRRPPPMTGRGPIQAGGGRYITVDQLEPMIKPLDPKLFDVGTPDAFRKALAAILGEISRM